MSFVDSSAAESAQFKPYRRGLTAYCYRLLASP
jgi:hypothetical protein